MLHILQPNPGPPKRGLNAYMFFCQDWRDRVKAENPGAPFGSDILLDLSFWIYLATGFTGLLGKILGVKWKEMNETEQEVS
jgi:hypothetical protein